MDTTTNFEGKREVPQSIRQFIANRRILRTGYAEPLPKYLKAAKVSTEQLLHTEKGDKQGDLLHLVIGINLLLASGVHSDLLRKEEAEITFKDAIEHFKRVYSGDKEDRTDT